MFNQFICSFHAFFYEEEFIYVKKDIKFLFSYLADKFKLDMYFHQLDFLRLFP